MLGGGRMSGSAYSNVALAEVETRQTFADFQAQGVLGGKEIAIYAQHAYAPPGSNGKANAYNRAGNICAVAAVCNPDRKATTIGVDYTVIPHALSIGAAMRRAKNGAVAAYNGDNSWTVTAVYDLYQNIAFHANYSQFSGSSRTAAAVGAGATDATLQKRLLTFMLEGAW